MQAFALRPRDVPLDWHEAAALVQLIAQHVADGRLPGIPPVEWLSVDDEGSVHVLAPPNVSPPDWTAGSPASALRELFRELVGPSAVPPALHAALESANDGTRIDSAAAFNGAIRFFVRPSNALRDVAVRLRQREEASRLVSELDDLTRKARSAEPQPTDHVPPAELPRPSKARRRRAMLFPVIGCSLALPILIVIGGRIGGGDRASPASAILKTGQELLKEARSGARSLLGGGAPVKEAAAAGSSGHAARVGSQRRLQVRARTEPLDRAAVVVTDVVPVSWILSVPVAAVPRLSNAPVTPKVGGDTLYDSDDAEVSPPLLVRPRLPSQPRNGTSLEQLGRLEVIIAPSGEVERVRLLATTRERRYYDAMLLPAVKAWVFAPARRHGVAVRYRLEIPLTH